MRYRETKWPVRALARTGLFALLHRGVSVSRRR
jgi:hypothetical protein